ncbi:GGDEF domain-containing protein [Eggerthella sp. YY7918]|uniref:GGDEF domain-containing protein n=1 Tax=Eggerthella sp. (strain YY7918) TaxID=502558 RepID=UPI000217194F|nr:GGDEF domain-containing protein [Eggerthella sp. YY7918]BAK45167.1 hypothetical protein EGYY_20770 [Eggerthella sp. YY7918]
MAIKLKTSRVDVQVCIIVAVVVVLSFICVYAFNYFVTYSQMIDSLKERCDGINTYVENVLDTSTFEGIESADDMTDPSYLAIQDSLERVKVATGARYLYTAKRADDGSLIYVVDGLPPESEDFRKPGDPIEEEIIPDMERALANEIVYPDDIMDTGWGYVFVAYYPIHEAGEVVGVVGIEFNAQRQYESFHMVRIGTPIIAGIFLLIAIVVSWLVFRRISNPWYRDMANTDYLTGLKNRNAFEIDLANWSGTEEAKAIGALSIDLDGLKEMNDTFGHPAGDEYIVAAARIVADACKDSGAVYRVGGDEFVALCFGLTESQAQQIIENMRAATVGQTVQGCPISLSIGWAVHKKGESVEQTIGRADRRMYEEKHARHENPNQA